MMTTEKHTDSFYVTGGTLRRDAACYVQRRADQSLYDGAMQGNFCYVLTSRQMGKSSLMVRTAARLREEGVHVAVLDLTSIGQNLNAEQWYDGLLARVGQQFQLEDAWLANIRLSPLLRWMNAIRDVVLPRLQGRIVIFVDEIDAVRSLPFSTDEFFAAIRELYNRRTEDAELERLTFCLLGVASPSDLIRDTRTTPFNIGQRIELNDFSDDEAAPLARGLGREDKTATKLLKRILYWTGGHPYLTQRLCQAAAEDTNVNDAAGIDRLCEDLFFTTRARERDDNLLFVRERMLKSEADRAALLDLYKKLRDNQRVKDDETNPLISVLRLSGITRVVEGLLYVRNRIYYRVFDREWVLANLPDAEVLRQKAAYRRGLWRAAAVAAVIIAALGALSFVAIRQRNRAVESEQTNRRLLYTAQMNLAGQGLKSNSFGRIIELLRSYAPANGQEDIRGFEWFYLWRLAHRDIATINIQGGLALRLSPDGKILAAGRADDYSITLWDTATQQELRALKGHNQLVRSLAFAPDGVTLASLSETGVIKLWNVITSQEIRTIDNLTEQPYALMFSPDGNHLAIGGSRGTISIMDCLTWKESLSFQSHKEGRVGIAYSPDGKQLVSSGVDGVVKVWDIKTTKETRSFEVEPDFGNSIAFSPDSKRLAISGTQGVKVFDVFTGKEPVTIGGKNLWGAIFSPDGKKLAAAGEDKVVRVWDAATGQELQSFKGHRAIANYLAFFPDSKKLISGRTTSEVKIWDVEAERTSDVIQGYEEDVLCSAFSVDGKRFATAGKEGVIKVWDTDSQKELFVLKGQTTTIWAISFCDADRCLVSVDESNSIVVWDIAARKIIRSFAGMPRSLVWPQKFSQDGKKVLLELNDDDNIIKILDVLSGKELFSVKEIDAGSAALSLDNKTLAVVNLQGEIKLFDVASSQQKAVLKGSPITWSIEFSPDGEKLAAGTVEGEVSMWEVKTGRRIFIAQGHADGITSLAFSPDGKRLVSGAFDHTLKIWDVNTGQEMLTLTGHSDKVESVRFSPDGKTVLSTSRDKTTRFWRAATDAEVQARRGQ